MKYCRSQSERAAIYVYRHSYSEPLLHDHEFYCLSGIYSRPDDQFLFSQTSVVMARTPTLTNEQMEQLIELFYAEPCLWDINDADYMNINSRTAALTRIGGVMKLSSDKQPIITVIIVLISNAGCRLIFKRGQSVRGDREKRPAPFKYKPVALVFNTLYIACSTRNDVNICLYEKQLGVRNTNTTGIHRWLDIARSTHRSRNWKLTLSDYR
jgi:hypothetical protein